MENNPTKKIPSTENAQDNAQDRKRLEQLKALMLQLNKQKQSNEELLSQNKQLTSEMEQMKRRIAQYELASSQASDPTPSTPSSSVDGNKYEMVLMEVTRLQEMNNALESDAKRQLSLRQEVEKKNEEVQHRLSVLVSERLEIENKLHQLQSDAQEEKRKLENELKLAREQVKFIDEVKQTEQQLSKMKEEEEAKLKQKEEEVEQLLEDINSLQAKMDAIAVEKEAFQKKSEERGALLKKVMEELKEQRNLVKGLEEQRDELSRQLELAVEARGEIENHYRFQFSALNQASQGLQEEEELKRQELYDKITQLNKQVESEQLEKALLQEQIILEQQQHEQNIKEATEELENQIKQMSHQQLEIANDLKLEKSRVSDLLLQNQRLEREVQQINGRTSNNPSSIIEMGSAHISSSSNRIKKCWQQFSQFETKQKVLLIVVVLAMLVFVYMQW